MLRLYHINLNQNPGLIQPPKVDDNMVIIKLVPDAQEVIAPDILDVALSYSIAGIDVILELPFADRDKFNQQQLASLICNGGWSLSLLAPKRKYNTKYKKTPTAKYAQEYAQEIIEWYELWRSQTMRNFEKVIDSITPYLEYLSTNYLIDKHQDTLSNDDDKALRLLSKNPTDVYLVEFIDNMKIGYVDQFKSQLKQFIDQNDRSFYKDIDLLTNQVAKAKCQT
jgi:cellobiose-specific phosphotransferase system component IIB